MAKQLTSHNIIGLMAILGSVIVGAAVNPVLARVGTVTIPVLIFVLLRQFVTVLMFSPTYWKYRSKLFTRKILKHAFWLSLLFGLNVTFFTLGINQTTLVASQLLYALLPITVSITAFFFLGEKLSFTKLLGIGLGFSGVILLVLNSLDQTQANVLGTFQGNATIFVAVLSYTAYLTYSKKYSAEIETDIRAGLSYFLLPVMFFPIAMYQIMAQSFQFSSVSFSSWIAVVGIGISSLVFMSLIQIGMSKLSATTVSFSTLLAPEIGALAGFMFYQEQLSWTLGLSLVLVLSGLFVHLSANQQNTWIDRVTAWIKK